MVFATKSFRKLNQRTPDNIFNLNFWYVEDPDLAQKLGIQSAGDVYLLKSSDEPEEVTHNDYNFKSRLFLKIDDLMDSIS